MDLTLKEAISLKLIISITKKFSRVLQKILSIIKKSAKVLLYQETIKLVKSKI